jgi:hypothetical protein
MEHATVEQRRQRVCLPSLEHAQGERMDRHVDELEDWLRLIQSEYFEMPGLRLTRPQMQRLWGLDSGECETVLNLLEAARFLRRTSSNAYVRADVVV